MNPTVIGPSHASRAWMRCLQVTELVQRRGRVGFNCLAQHSSWMYKWASCERRRDVDMGVSKNMGKPPNSSILIGFSMK